MKKHSGEELRQDNVSTLTKVLINKAHGGRKMDSKFWRDDIYLDKKNLDEPVNIPIEEKKKGFHKRASTYFLSLTALLGITISLIITRPDLFPFLEYHHIYNTVNNLFKSKSITTNYGKNIQENKTYQTTQNNNYQPPIQAKTHPITKPKKTVKLSNNYNYKDIERISLKGKVFSWIDKEGKKHFSNTNYPANNPTLTYRDEIKYEVPVTKISVKNGQVYLPVTIHNNGKSITRWMCLDTGCSITNLNFSDLKKLNVKYKGTSTSILADGSKKKNWKAEVDWIKIGSNYEYNFTVNGSKRAGSQNRGLLGLDFLKKHPFKIDFDNEFIVWM